MRRPRAGVLHSRPIVSAVEGLARRTPPVWGYRTARRMMRASSSGFGGWLALVTFAEALAAEQKDFGVLHEASGDGRRDGGVVKDVAPLGKRGVRGDDGTAAVTMASGDNLIKQIRGLLIERQVAELVHDEQGRIGVQLELADQRVIYLGSRKLVQHIHGSGEQDAFVGLTGPPAEDLGQEAFTHAGIADDDDIGSVIDEVQVEQMQNAILSRQSGLVVCEVEGVNGVLRMQP